MGLQAICKKVSKLLQNHSDDVHRRRRDIYMRKQITQLSNLVEAIDSKMISVTNIEIKTKSSTDITATEQVTPEVLIESLQFLNEAVLFRNGIDFYYEFTGDNSIRIEAGMKNKFLDEYFYVDCVIQDGFSADDVDAKFRESVFDRLAV